MEGLLQCMSQAVRRAAGASQPTSVTQSLNSTAPAQVQAGLRCVVLNCCNSLDLGRQIHAAGVPFVVCWETLAENRYGCRPFTSQPCNSSLHALSGIRRACVAFSRQFYTQLLHNGNISHAFTAGVNAMCLGNMSPGDPLASLSLQQAGMGRMVSSTSSTAATDSPSEGQLRSILMTLPGTPDASLGVPQRSCAGFGVPALFPASAISDTTQALLNKYKVRVVGALARSLQVPSSSLGFGGSFASSGRTSPALSQSSVATGEASAWPSMFSTSRHSDGTLAPGEAANEGAGDDVPPSRSKRPRTTSGSVSPSLLAGNWTDASDAESLSTCSSTVRSGTRAYYTTNHMTRVAQRQVRKAWEPSQAAKPVPFGRQAVLPPGGAAATFRGALPPPDSVTEREDTAWSQRTPPGCSTAACALAAPAEASDQNWWGSSQEGALYVAGGRGWWNAPSLDILRLTEFTGGSSRTASDQHDSATFPLAKASWACVGQGPQHSVGMAACACPQGLALLGGSPPDKDLPSRSAFVLSTGSLPADHSLQALPDLPAGVRHAGAAWSAPESQLTIVGGCLSRGATESLTAATTAVYQLLLSGSGQAAWVEGVPMPSAKYAFGCCEVASGSAVLVAGGIDASSSVCRTVSLLDTRCRRWEDLPSLNHARAYFSVAPDGRGRVYAVGGQGPESRALSSVEFLDMRMADKWYPAAPLPLTRRRVATAMVPGQEVLLALGGQRALMPNRRSVDVFSLDGDVWEAGGAPELPAGRGDCVAVWVPNSSSVL